MHAAASEFIETVIRTPMTFRGVCSERKRVHDHRTSVIMVSDMGRAAGLARSERPLALSELTDAICELITVYCTHGQW
jgi:hypothetical protein